MGPSPDAGLDHHVYRGANNDEVLNVVAPDEDELAELIDRNIGPNQLAVDAFLADTPGDQLGVLRAKIEDRDDFIALHLNVIRQRGGEIKISASLSFHRQLHLAVPHE